MPKGLELADHQEVMMSMSQYEERFRSPTPSLHQIFAATGGPNRGRQWARRLWVAGALVGVMTISCKVASHYTVQSEIHGSRLHIFSHEFRLFLWAKSGSGAKTANDRPKKLAAYVALAR